MVLKNPQIFLHKQLIVSYNGEQFIKKYPSGWWLNSAVSVVTHRAVALADFPEDSHYISGILPKPPALLSPSCLPCDNIQYYQFQLHLLLLIQNSALLPQGPAVAVRQHVFQEHGASASDSPELGFPSQAGCSFRLCSLANPWLQTFALNSLPKHGLSLLDSEGRR